MRTGLTAQRREGEASGARSGRGSSALALSIGVHGAVVGGFLLLIPDTPRPLPELPVVAVTLELAQPGADAGGGAVAAADSADSEAPQAADPPPEDVPPPDPAPREAAVADMPAQDMEVQDMEVQEMPAPEPVPAEDAPSPAPVPRHKPAAPPKPSPLRLRPPEPQPPQPIPVRATAPAVPAPPASPSGAPSSGAPAPGSGNEPGNPPSAEKGGADAPATAAAAADGMNAYLAALRRRLQGNLVYPAEARRLRLAGAVVVRFAILADGSIAPGARVMRSGGTELLDEAALATVQRAAPFPPPPVPPTVIEVPVAFQLR